MEPSKDGRGAERRRARALIVGDDAKKLHLIAPDTALVDLSVLNQWSGRQLRTESFEPIAAIPGFYEHPLVVDRRLAEWDPLALATERPDEYVTLTRAEFDRDAAAASVLDFCVDVGPDPTPPTTANDHAQVIASVRAFTELRLRQRLDQTLTIPPLPEATRRILELKADADFDVRDLTRVVEADPSLSARIIGWANSAYYGLREPVRSIADAIVRVMGPQATLNMALAIAMQQDLKVPKAHVRGMSPYWLQAMYTAATMETLATLVYAPKRPLPGYCYLAGLLANFGTLVIGHVFPPFYAAICREQEANRHLPHTYVDQHVLGVPRELFAAALLESWSVPKPVSDAVRFQYVDDHVGPHATYVGLLRLTHQVLANRGLSDAPRGPIDQQLLAKLSLDASAIDNVLAVISESAEQLDGMAHAATC
ncbi:MAG TPA: HDOD domain-containing protein [Pseudomonadales bacterium]|nr:HDOD domain-containing protein [Pseudomonadales bacterium]